MKVIFLKDVPKTGKKFEVKEISDGYALNFLMPKGLVEKATPEALAKLKNQIEASKTQEKIQEELLQMNFEALKNVEIEIKRPANEEGHLFGGVHAKDISQAILDKTKIEVPEHAIILSQPIKTTGRHEIKIQTGSHKTTVSLDVSKE